MSMRPSVPQPPTTRTAARARRATLLAAALASAALLVAGCASSSSSSSGSSASASAGSSGADSGLAKAQAQVQQLEATTTTYPVPTAPVPDVSKLAGRTVFFIPLIQQIPTFVVAAEAMKEALAKAGLTMQVCDGKATPSAIASCVQQAVAADAAGLVLDAIPYGMAQNALDAAKGKGIPIVVADQFPPDGFTPSNEVSYVPGVIDQPSQIAWWIIADSKGSANTIIAGEKDSPSAWQYVQDSLPIYEQNCPNCKVSVKAITATSNDLLASATSSNILSTPGVGYYYTEFEDSLQPTIQGVQQSGKTSSISVACAAGTTAGLGMIKANGPLKALVVVDEPYEGWALADQVLRMATGAGPVTQTVPSRLFTKENIDSIQITADAQLTGEWFGDSSFKASFAKLWGK